MEANHTSIRLQLVTIVIIVLNVFFSGLAQAQWDAHYWADEIKRLEAANVQLMLDEPMKIGLEIQVIDSYYTVPSDCYFLEYPEDVSGSIMNSAVAFLTSIDFAGKPVQAVLHDLADHLLDTRASNVVSVAFEIPPQFRGSPPYRLFMEVANTEIMWTSITLKDLDDHLPGAGVNRIDLTWKTVSTEITDPGAIRSFVYEFLVQHPVEPESVGISTRMLAEQLQAFFGDIQEVTSEMQTMKSVPEEVHFKTRLVWSDEISMDESLTMRFDGNPEGTDGSHGRGYRLVLDYEAGLETGDLPELATLHDFILDRTAAFDPAVNDWKEFMNQTLEQIKSAVGLSAEYISFYMDGDVGREDVEIRYLSRKGIPMYGDGTLYTGYELVLNNLETFLESVVRYQIEIADFYLDWEVSMPGPEVMADTLISHALRPVFADSLIHNEVLLNRYLNSLAYNFGDFSYWYWEFLYNGTITSEISGTDGRGTAFRHTLDGIAGSSGKFAEGSGVPAEIRLLQNYPNPFNPVTHISFEIGQAMNISLEIFDLTGRKVAEPASGKHDQGMHTVRFDARNLASGLYIARLQAGNEIFHSKMMLIK
jgi:hypothetical protein